MTSSRCSSALLAVLLLLPSAARAQSTDAPPTPAEKKSKYALPFAMRPAIAPNLLRIDGAWAIQDRALTTTSILTAGYKPIASLPDLGFYARTGFVRHAPDGVAATNMFTNPLAFVLYTPEIAPKWRLPLFAGVALPIGSTNVAIRSGVFARQAMDNALFATNYITPTIGAGIAWVDRGFTVQAEAQVLQLMRVKNADVDPDSSRTNLTMGLNVGYQLVKYLTVSGELHYQRWLSTPVAVQRDAVFRDQATYGGGLRGNFPLSDTVVFRPGIAYFRAFDKPMTSTNYQIVQVDLPIAF